MANKDDDFDFKWDDDASFDSELDNFGGDVDEYHSDEVKDATKDRNPVVNKLKSIAPTINDAGSAVLAGAGVGIAKTIEHDMPEVHGVYTGATHAISEAQVLRNEVTDKVKPWWNDTKRVLRKLSQQLSGELPFALDKKILKLIGEEDSDQEYKQPSKEDMRREQMNSNINSIFELQMQKSMEQQKDTILNRTLDRRIANVHHKESAGFLSKIAENAVFQHAFTSSVFTAYLKKDLELKYKHFYVAEDTLEVFKNHAKAVDNKLDAVIKNTALPEADKVYMSERITGDLKKRFSEGFNEKLSNYFGKIRENIVDKVKDAVDIGELLTTALSTQSEMLEYMDEDDDMGMSMASEPSIFTKKGIMHALLGKVGGFFAKRMLRKFTKNLPQETLETIQHYLRGGSNGIALLIDDIKSGRIKGIPDELRDLIYDFAPDLGRNNDPVIVNEGWHTLDKGGKITNKFIKTVEDVIPNYLAMQTRYLEIMATNTDSGIQKWNFKTLRMETEKERTEDMYKSITHTSDQGKARLQHGIIETGKLIEHTTAHLGTLGETYKANLKKALRANAKDIEIFKINLAHSEQYYQVDGEKIVSELEHILKAKNTEELRDIPLYNVGFQDIKAVKAVAGFWLDVLADRTSSGALRPNGAAVDHLNMLLLDEKAKASKLYRQVMEDAYKTGNYDVARKVLGATTTTAGDIKINARDLYVRELDTKATSGEIFSYNEKEVVKQFNEAFRNIKEDELHKNYFVEKFKDIIEKVKKINPTEFAEDMLESPFKKAYLKIYGKDKEKEAERAWRKFLSNVDKTTEFIKNEYDKATEAIDKALDKLKCRSLEEFFDALAEVINKDNAKAWRRLKDSVVIRENNGKTVRNLSGLAPEEWYDFFGLLEDPAGVAKLFDSGSSTATVLRSLFPKDIQLLIYSINNDSTLVEKMKAINKQHNNDDAASVNLRQSKLKKLITESIDKTKKKIGERETSKIWKTSRFNINQLNAADKTRFQGLVARRNELNRDIQQAELETSLGRSTSRNIADIKRDMENVEKEILKIKQSQNPEFYGYDEEIKKSIAEKEKQRTSVSSDNFNGSSSINLGKQQLDILKSIDEQLGHFYHAFIDINFRNAELARMTDGKLTGEHANWYNTQDAMSTSEYGAEVAKWIDILHDPTMKAYHPFARKQLQDLEAGLWDYRYQGRDEFERLNNRNDVLREFRGHVKAATTFASKLVDINTGAIYSSITELDDKIDKLINNNVINATDSEEIRHARFEILRSDRRKHFIKLLKTVYKNDKNPLYAELAQIIVNNENIYLNNVNATISDEYLYNWIINKILEADDDTRTSTIKYLRVLLIRSSSLTTTDERDDIKIGIIQEFLPKEVKHIFSMALDYIRAYETNGGIVDTTQQTKARNIESMGISGSSYKDIHHRYSNLAESTNRLNTQLDNAIDETRYADEGDVHISPEDKRRVEDLIIQRGLERARLDAANTILRDVENGRMNSNYNNKNIYADEHSWYIANKLTKDGNVDYTKAIEYIENIGRSRLRKQSVGKELATNAFGEKVASNKELISNTEYANMQEIIDSADAIRERWSTSDDIKKNGIETLHRMLTTIYQNINLTDKKPSKTELSRIYHAITGKVPPRRIGLPRRFASGSSISFDLPIDKLGGYVDQPTKILGGAGIAGEAGGETIIPHKYNERFKELIYRCLKDTVGENMARKVLRMMKPSDATQDKLGINLSDAGGSRMFAKGGFIGRLWNSLFKRKKKEEKSEDSPTEQDKLRERIETIDAELADYAENNNRRADYIEKIRKEKADLESQLKTEDKPKEEYTQRHEPTSMKNILLNIMESNEAIYKKMGDGLLVVDLAAMLDKLKNTELLKKLKSLKIGERIKNFIFGAYDTGKGLVHRAYNIGKGIVKTAAMNVGSFGRHMFTNKVCDVYLKSDIEGEKHGPKKIDASELEHGTIFADEKCTKPIYSVADIHPPVYRKKVDENGNTVVEEAIREDEAKDGLVDVEGNSLLRFGGKIGRFLRHVVTTPLKAIFTHKNWERLKGLGSSIMSGIGSGVNGFLDAYCDVYSKLDNAKEMLVSGEAIKEGRLVRIRKEGDKPKVVPTVFDIDGECWIMVDDPDNPDKRKLGNQVIRADHIKAGLCHKDGSPIESSKIAKAAAMLRRAVGAVGNGIASLTGGAFNIGATVISWAWDKGKAAAKWVKDRVKDAFTAKNPYIDVYVIRDNEKKIVMHADELKTNKATQRYCYIAKDGKVSPVLSAYGIDAPVYDMRGTKIEDTDTYDRIPVEIISQDDVDKQAIYDIEGNQLTKWAGRSLAGKIGAAALGAVKVGWKALKGLGKGLWNVGKTVLGGIGTLLGEGGAAVTGFFTKAWSSTLDFFRNSVISRKDLQEIVGDRLLDIYGLLYKYMPRKEYDPNDIDKDGDIDGSWADYEQKRKEREAKREQDRLDQWYKDHPNAEEHSGGSFWSKIKNAFKGSGDDSSGGFFSNLLDMYMGYLGFKDAKGLFGKLFGRKGAARATTVTPAAMSGKKGLFARLANSMRGLFDRPTAKNGFKRGKLYSAGRWLNELFFGNMSSPGGTKRGIVNAIRGLFHKKGAAAAGEAAASSATEAGKMATAWNWFKGLFGKGAAGKATEREIAALQAKAAAHHAKFMGAAAGRAATSTAARAATNAAAKAAAKGVLGRIGARLAAATAANLSGPVIGQIISAGMYLWTGYEIIKYFVTDSSKVKGLRPVRFKAYGVSPKYWEAIEDLETDTFSEFKAGHAEGVPVDRLKKFGYKIDFLDASEMAYGGDKLEYIKTWYRFKFVPFYQKYAQSIIIACKLDPNSQPKGDDIPDEVYSTIILQLTKGFDRINVGPLKELKLDKASYEKWLAKKREKDREEGLESGKYSNKDLADSSVTSAATKLVGNITDHLGYAWNEFKHGNILNAIGAVGKAHRAAMVKLVAHVADNIWNYATGFDSGLMGKTSKNEKAWDEVRFKLYGLDKSEVSKKEYERISKLIKDFEIHQIHVIDGEEKMVEDDLVDLAEEIFTEQVRKNTKFKLNSSGIPIVDTSKDLYSESTGFVISWYKRIFLPIFTLYANAVRAACGGKPGDNIVIDSIPEDQRADLLKEFERQAKAMLAKNIDTEILRLSPVGFYEYLSMRSEEDIAEFAKDSKDLVSEDELGFSDKLSRNLDDAGSDLAKAWALKFKNPTKALGLAVKGVGKAIWGTFKTVGTSIGQSIADFLHGSANEHRWETRFFDYGFTSRSGSSDVFKNQNLKAMEEFEAEAGKQLLEDNTGKPDEQFFVRIALNSGFIEDCCQKVFGSGSGISEGTLNATNTRTLNSAILKYSTPIGWIDTLGSKFTNKVFGINTLSELKEKIIDYLSNNIKDNADFKKEKLNIKTKVGDIINYLDFWWTIRFKPVFDAFIGVVSAYGVEPDDIDVDNIPEEARKQAYDEYKKAASDVLKKDNRLVYTLSANGCAAYLEKLEEYREDAKDGTIDNADNPLAKFYKEKEEEFENTVVAAVVANAGGMDKEEKARVSKALAKASIEIDSELNDVNTMAKYAAKDILDQLGVVDLLHPSRSVKDSIYGILMKLTMGENHYDKTAKGSGLIFDDSLGKLFVKFIKNAHDCLYGTDADKLSEYLKEFAESCMQSDIFAFKDNGMTVKFGTIELLNKWLQLRYRNVAIDDMVTSYFGHWFAYRFMPYYAYFVTLINKANEEKDPKEFPDIGKLTVMKRNYVIDKLAKSENKGLISFKAKSMKVDANSMAEFFSKLNEGEGNRLAIGRELRSNGRKFLEERRKDLEKQLAEDREKRKTANQSKEGVKRYVEDKNLADVNVLSTGRPGALIGGKNTKRKGRSCTEEERQYIYNFLTSELGLTPEQAAAVMGNMMAESTMSPTAINKDGGGDGAHGLFQWRGPRLKGGGAYTGLIPFAKALGLDPYSVEAQMKYFKHEIETVPYERSQFNSLVRSIVTDPRNPNKTIAQAVVGFRKGFERCGDYEARDSERVGYAKDFYRKYGPSQVPSYMPNTSVLDTATTDNTGTTGAVTNTPPVSTSQSTNVQSDIATIPANTTSSVGVSGSKQPTYSGSYGNVSDRTKKACDYVTAHSHERSLGKCARYVANALQAAGYKFNRQPSAYMYHTNGILTKMGFTCMGSTNARPQAGDVCVINRFKGHPHGHICMYNGQQWISDFRQRTASPYKAGAPGGIWYYRPNGSTASSTNNATTNIVSNVNSDIVKNNQIVYEHAVNKVRSNSAVEQVKPTPASVISNTSTEGTNDNIRTLSAMQTDITNANSGNAPIVSELKLISSILSAFKGDVSGFIHMLTNTAGLTKAGDTTKATTTVTNNKSISDEGLRILVDKLNELAQLITTTNPNVARTSPKYHARDDYMQGYPLQTNKVSS